MSSMSPSQQVPPQAVPPSLRDALAAPVWMHPDDELLLGCECANPALQIDSWSTEASRAAPPR